MQWGLLTLSAGGSPVTESELAEHLRLDTWTPGGELARLLEAATRAVEAATNRKLLTTSVRLMLSAFPRGRALILPHAPLEAVTSFSWRTRAGTVNSWTISGDILSDSIGYIARVEKDRPAIWVVTGAWWPADELDTGLPISVEATYGATVASSVPAPLKHAVLLLAAHYFEHREAATGEKLTALPLGVDSLLAPYRVHTHGYDPL